MKDMVRMHIYPARFRTQNWETLRTFLGKVSDLALAMGVNFNAIEPETEEDRQALMKLIGATKYTGTFKLNELQLTQKVKAARDESLP
jgi:hypothetical protein